jgi:hypothetical protein
MQATEKQHEETNKHMANFLTAVKSRNYRDLAGDVEQGAVSADLVHMANISYRLKRRLAFEESKHAFHGDAEANAMQTRPKYRVPYIVPEKV